MTVYCGGGSSAARPGLGATVAVGAGSIAALLTAIPLPFAVPLAGYLGLVSYDLATFCAGEPPTLPTITAGDVAALLTVSDPVGHDIALQKFLDLVGFYYWDQFCECSGVPNPTLPTPQTDPNGGTSVDPRVVPPISQTYCYDQVMTLTPATTPQYQCPTGTNQQLWSVSGDLLPAPSIGVARVSPCTDFPAFSFPPGVIGGKITWKSIAGFASSRTNASLTATTYKSDGSAAGGGIIAINGSPTNGNVKTANITPGTTPAYMQIGYSDNTFTSSDQLSIEIQLTCSATPTIQQPCCPPDQTLSAQIQAIMQLVTLIQRQVAPFSYNAGAVHSGLTGSGELSIQGLLGAKVLPTTIPSHFGSEAGDPDTLWLESWINWGNADGFTKREFLRSAPFLSLPALGGQFTKLGYSLAPGLVVDITELKREP